MRSRQDPSEDKKRLLPAELIALIRLYSQDIESVEDSPLIEYVSMALELMDDTSDKASLMTLAAEVVELGRKNVMPMPAWTIDHLADAIRQARRETSIQESALVRPLLTLYLQTFSPLLEQEAEGIINRCYQRVLSGEGSIADLYIATTCCEYIDEFDIHSVAARWNQISADCLEIIRELGTSDLIRIIDSANILEEFSIISTGNKSLLISALSSRAEKGDLEAATSLRILLSMLPQAV